MNHGKLFRGKVWIDKGWDGQGGGVGGVLHELLCYLSIFYTITSLFSSY